MVIALAFIIFDLADFIVDYNEMLVAKEFLVDRNTSGSQHYSQWIEGFYSVSLIKFRFFEKKLRILELYLCLKDEVL